MFNAIFGNFLFSSSNRGTVAEQVSDESNGKVKSLSTEASTQTASISVQTSLEFDGVGSNDDNNVMTDTKTYTTNGSQNPLDWVIIDSSEGNMSIDTTMDESQLESNNQDNLVEMGCANDPSLELPKDVKQSFYDDGDALLGSFFDKNENDDEPKSQVIMSSIFHSGLGLNENYDNESDDEEQLHETIEEVPARKDETWLITPLPCLTSITESSHQRSMIDNYPLENLLIEHPSMSVFISATNATTQNSSSSVATCSPRQQKLSQSVSLPLINVSNQIEVTQLDDICCEMIVRAEKSSTDLIVINKNNKKKNKKANKKNTRKPNRKVPRRSVTFDKGQESVTEFDLEPIIFIIGDESEQPAVEEQVAVQDQEETVSEVVELQPTIEIVEATVMQQVAIVEQQIESANSSITSFKKSKKSKKSKSLMSTQAKTGIKSASNKENMQVKTLLLNDVKKSVTNHAANNRFDLGLLNKNQMRRNNKNTTFSSMRNVNSQQRKYHKLQQPSFSVNVQQF